MKKMFLALAALVLAFTACTSEDEAIQTNEQKAVKVVVNMDKPSFGEDTRAARDGWEGDEEVVVVLNNYFGAFVHLYYVGEWKASYYKYDGEEFDAIYDYNVSEFIGNLKTKLGDNGDLKAIYLSSGDVWVIDGGSTPEARASNPVQNLELLDDVPETLLIQSTASNYYGGGECIMTCEDGSYQISGNEVDGYELTFNINLVPQVAQFTIRNLDFDYESTDEGLFVSGALTAYAGATLTSRGFELIPIAPDSDGEICCWPHANEDGVSIYASPWEESKDGVDKGTFGFHYWKDESPATRTFTDKTELRNGDAVIMDGPNTKGTDGEPTAGAQEWN